MAAIGWTRPSSIAQLGVACAMYKATHNVGTSFGFSSSAAQRTHTGATKDSREAARTPARPPVTQVWRTRLGGEHRAQRWISPMAGSLPATGNCRSLECPGLKAIRILELILLTKRRRRRLRAREELIKFIIVDLMRQEILIVRRPLGILNR